MMTSTPDDPSDPCLIADWALHADDARAEPGVPTDTVQQQSADTVQQQSADTVQQQSADTVQQQSADTVQQRYTATIQRPSASASARYAARAGRRDGIALVPSSDPAAARSQLFGQPPV